jgi:hypothetical protein
MSTDTKDLLLVTAVLTQPTPNIVCAGRGKLSLVSANLSQPTPMSSAQGEGSYLWCRLTKASRYYSKDTDCHNIDLIHVTKNVFDNIIRTLLDITRKMKDELKSRNDLIQFGLRPELHPMLRANGKHYIPPPPS